MSSAVVWLVTPILDACNIETMPAIFSSLRLCSHTGSVKLQIQNDKLLVIKFLDNSPCHICTWLSKIYSILLKKPPKICGISGDFFTSLAQWHWIMRSFFKCCRSILTESKSIFLQDLEWHIQITCCSPSV